MKHTIVFLLCLSALSCGKAPELTAPIVAPSPPTAVASSAPKIIEKTYCGMQFLVGAPQVTDLSGVAISNGVYNYGGTFTPQGFLIPFCSYTVLDGSIWDTQNPPKGWGS